eukprot:6188128-Pleurochrysis_carterae.AAC.6
MGLPLFIPVSYRPLSVFRDLAAAFCLQRTSAVWRELQKRNAGCSTVFCSFALSGALHHHHMKFKSSRCAVLSHMLAGARGGQIPNQIPSVI